MGLNPTLILLEYTRYPPPLNFHTLIFLREKCFSCWFYFSSGGYLSDSVDSCGSTPLMDSLRGNHIDIASLLITKVKDLKVFMLRRLSVKIHACSL